MKNIADLELALHRRDGTTYAVETRLLPPGADIEVRAGGTLELDLDALRGEGADEAYGLMLGTALLADAEVAQAIASARAQADTADASLRVRLLVGPTALELHSLRWEAARDPQTRATLFTGDKLLFSRYVSSNDWRPAQAKSDLRAFAFIANPGDIARYNLSPVRVEVELEGIQAAFGAAVKSQQPGEHATLAALVAALREGVDVLYLVAHGKLIKGEPKLYFEKDDGSADVVNGSDLVARLSELRVRPRLVVLGSCQSAGTADQQAAEGYMAALGPRLAASGIAAVVAMQGTVSMDTEALFMAAFFKQLRRDGLVDAAMSVARSAVLMAKRPDWWMPVLFMRLKSGRVWYEPGFVNQGENGFDKWRAICAQVLKGDFVPILGPELGEEEFGSSRELANRLADVHAFPLAPHQRHDLAAVTQFISISQNRTYVHDAVSAAQLRMLAEMEAERAGGAPAEGTKSLVYYLKLAAQRSQDNPASVYRRLADLGASIYVNASYEATLMQVLKGSERQPEAIYTTWRGTEVPKPPVPKNPRPDRNAPWVYNVFGRYSLGVPKDKDKERDEENFRTNMVLTEDDFFDYLIATSRLDLLLPTLKGRLMQSSLLFLGFRLDDWRFRVLFRLIVNQQGTRTMDGLSHVGVQVNPDEQSLADAERARKYMESYFKGGRSAPEVSIYWGSAGEFLAELDQNLERARKEPPVALPSEDDEGYGD